jgi:uncharacterized membrane protein (DUF2068 family)
VQNRPAFWSWIKTTVGPTRVIAAFEAAKGMLVLIAGFGLLSVLDKDLQQLAEELVRHLHLNPANRYPRIFLEAAERFSDLRLWMLAVLAFAYAVIRLTEAYGLWLGRRWAEWFAVLSGGIYVPMELYELSHGATRTKVVTLTVNVLIVAFMAITLWSSRRREPIDGTVKLGGER